MIHSVVKSQRHSLYDCLYDCLYDKIKIVEHRADHVDDKINIVKDMIKIIEHKTDY